MSRLEFYLWGVDFVISGISYFFGGPYAVAVCFVVGGVLILIGFFKKDESETTHKAGTVLFDHTNQPYHHTRRIRGWHKWGAVAFGLCSIILISYKLFGASKKETIKIPVQDTSRSNESYSATHSAVSDSPKDDNSQYELLHLSPKQKAKFERLKVPLFRLKATMLDSPEHYKYERCRDEYRTELENMEDGHGCLIDTEKIQCFPKPPAVITRNDVDISISAKMVADELSKTFFWIVKNTTTKVRVPVVLDITLINRRPTPLKIDLIYLDARSVDGWADIRMADSALPAGAQTMEQRPLVLQGKNGALSIKGEYLLPFLYDRVLQPGDKAEGWLIAEYPRGFKYGSSIGDMRISVYAGNEWIASKTFPANPRSYENQTFNSFVITLDTLITEDW